MAGASPLLIPSGLRSVCVRMTRPLVADGSLTLFIVDRSLTIREAPSDWNSLLLCTERRDWVSASGTMALLRDSAALRESCVAVPS